MRLPRPKLFEKINKHGNTAKLSKTSGIIEIVCLDNSLGLQPILVFFHEKNPSQTEKHMTPLMQK